MRICVAHETLFSYAAPASGVIQSLRLTPRSHSGQYVVDWRIDVSADCRLDPQEDAFGNIVHAFSTGGPIAELRLAVEGEVETQDMAGVVRGATERFPPSLFLRETALTRADDAVLAYAAQFSSPAAPSRAPDNGNGATLSTLHALLARLHEDMVEDTGRETATCDVAAQPGLSVPVTATEALARKRGTANDLTHVYIAVSRALGVPARFVSGYFRAPAGVPLHDGGHAWVEAYVPDLGWVGFDPANGVCVTDQHIRVAMGLDYLGAAAVRCAHYGGGSALQSAKLSVTQSSCQAQE